MATTYTISSMRVVRVSPKISEKHPERIYTVYGQFYKDGDKHPLSITSKNIDKDDISHPEFKLDLSKGILILNEGQKGRKKSVSLSQEEIEAELAALTSK